MVKKPDINLEGQELLIPNDKLDEKPITITFSQAKAIAKSLRPPPSDKQREHMQKLVEQNRLKWQQKKEDKKKKLIEEQQAKEEVSTRVLVAPKRLYKNKLKKELEQDYDEDSEDEIQIIKKSKPKKVIKKIIEEEEEDSDDDVIQKTKKATKLLDTVTKLDKKIEEMKTNKGRYETLFSKYKF